jgi:hypothetical protein
MSRRQLVRRARVSALTFVLVTVLARLIVPALWSWSLVLDTREAALQRALDDTGTDGEQEALKEKLWQEWGTNETDQADIVERLEQQIGTFWMISILLGVAAGGLGWIPTAPKNLAPHHRHRHHRQSRPHHSFSSRRITRPQ